MSGKFAFWFRWLQAACIAVQAFGVFMVVWQPGTRAFFGTLLLGSSSAIGAFQQPALSYVDLLHVVLGAVLLGWGTALLLLVRALCRSHPLVVFRVVAVSIAFWTIPDTAYSLWSGFWQNAVLNAVFVAVFVPPLVALRGASRE